MGATFGSFPRSFCINLLTGASHGQRKGRLLTVRFYWAAPIGPVDARGSTSPVEKATGQSEGGGVRTKKDQSTAAPPGRTRVAKEAPGGEVTAGVGKKRRGRTQDRKSRRAKKRAQWGGLVIDLQRPLAVSCGFLRSFRGLFRGGGGLPGTPFTRQTLVLNTAPCLRRWGELSVSWQVRPGFALAQLDEPRPLLFFGAGPARYHVRVGAFAQHLVRERHAAGGLVKGEGTGDCSVTNIGGRDLIGALLRHKNGRIDLAGIRRGCWFAAKKR